MLGHDRPVFDIIVALVCGGVSLTTHSVKAGTRLVANTSPEPFSNIALSLTEDAGSSADSCCSTTIRSSRWSCCWSSWALFFYFTPKIVRALKVIVWLIWKKLNAPAAGTDEAGLSDHLPPDIDILFHELNVTGKKSSGPRNV